MDREYSAVVEEHLKHYRQMAFLCGPRQVGKTTCSKSFKGEHARFYYLNWETSGHRRLIFEGAEAVARYLKLDTASSEKPLVVFDEIHKYSKWKLFLKGFFDLYEDRCQIIVTGSAKLNVYQRGEDSLMGRYFPYRIHPLSIGELARAEMRKKEILPPKKVPKTQLDRLLKFGGFPEPFTKSDLRFSNNWQRLRKQQLLREDIRELSQIQDLPELELLVDLLVEESGQQLNIASFSNQLNVAESTLHRWIKVLESFYFCYRIKPWSKNVRRAIRKTPKLYLWDWSMIADGGSRVENLIASHLLKSVHLWTDLGFGEYDLFYVRDKNKNEVDFLVTKGKEPWFLVEAKVAQNKGITKSLYSFYEQLGVAHAFQVVYDLPYEEVDCFKYKKPVIVPASTLLSQLP
ncbi:MAG: ATP-binding protein [Chlamydiales bacterium]|nr:ATP-binding protein [Chlamydiales bacterium]